MKKVTITFEELPKTVSEMNQRLNDIFELLNESPKAVEQEVWLSVNDLQAYHPDKPAKQTIYGWINRKEIPYHKGGKKLRFKKSEIDQWLECGGQKKIGEAI